jgi:hypothetical protein
MGPRAVRALWWVIACLCAGTGRADEIGVFGLAGMYNTNNPDRVSTGAMHDNVGYVTLGTYGAWQTGRLTSHWNLDESGITYLHSKYGSKSYPTANLRSTYEALSGIVSWRLMEDFGQIVSNPGQADTPLNRGDFNVFSTGPKLKIPLGARTFVESSALYTHSYYELSTLSGDSNDVELGINRSLAPKMSLGIYAGRTDGSTEQYGRFNTQRASLRFLATGAWTTLVVDGGLNRAERPVRTGNLPFYGVDMVRKLPTGSQIEFSASRALTNAAQQFGVFSSGATVPATTGGGAPPGSAIDLNTTTDLFDATTVRASASTKPRRTEWAAGLSWRKEDALPGFHGDHRRYATVDFSYYRVWNSKTGIRFYGAYGITRGEIHADQYDHYSVVGCEFAKPINTNALRWVATLERSTRTSNNNEARYEEIRIGFYLRYSKFVYQRE